MLSKKEEWTLNVIVGALLVGVVFGLFMLFTSNPGSRTGSEVEPRRGWREASAAVSEERIAEARALTRVWLAERPYMGSEPDVVESSVLEGRWNDPFQLAWDVLLQPGPQRWRLIWAKNRTMDWLRIYVP